MTVTLQARRTASSMPTERPVASKAMHIAPGISLTLYKGSREEDGFHGWMGIVRIQAEGMSFPTQVGCTSVHPRITTLRAELTRRGVDDVLASVVEVLETRTDANSSAALAHLLSFSV